MEFIVLLSVFAITLTQVIARPADRDYLTNNGIDGRADDLEAFKLWLPTVVRNNTQIVIDGTLNLSHQNFAAMLPIEGGDDEKTCKFNYNYERNLLEVSPLLETDLEQYDEPIYYYISNNPEPQFTLYLDAKDINGSKMFELTFQEPERGLSDTVICKIDSFDKISHILFKEGVKNITSILFKI